MPVITFPDLHTQRLRLTTFSSEDADAIFAYGSDPLVSRFTSWPVHQAVDNSAAWIARVTGGERRESGRVRRAWAVRLMDSPAAVGAVEFHQKPEDVGRVDYVLARSLWGQGLMSEAVSAVIDWAFRELSDLVVIRSGGLTENVGSMRVMQKVGMTLERQEQIVIPKLGDSERSVSHYAISRGDWLTRGMS